MLGTNNKAESTGASSGGDVRVERLRRLEGDAREQEIADLVVSVAKPLIVRVVRRSTAVAGEDAEDIVSTVVLRVMQKLRAIAEGAADVIHGFDDYVAMLAYNAINDHLRRRYPQRTRVRNRLQYALGHDPRLDLWPAGNRLHGGLARWKRITAAGDESVAVPEAVLRRMSDGARPADDLVLLFEQLGRPVPLDALVAVCAARWKMTDVARPAPEPVSEPASLAGLVLRERLEAVWREIALLRPMQRKALLLNLRAPGIANMLALLDVTGVAGSAAIAGALEMTQNELAAIWNELPLDDLRIASMLRITRQQVISLRRSARERLTRRLANAKKP